MEPDPMMLEAPEPRWAFNLKIYSIVVLQMLLTVTVASVAGSLFDATMASVALYVPTVFGFFAASGVLWITLINFAFMLLFLLHYYCKNHPVNLILLVAFTVAISFAVGVSCAFTGGKVIKETVILTTVMVISLTVVFWEEEFTFLHPLDAVMVFVVFGLLQMLFPFGEISVLICGGLAAIMFCGYIVDNTNNLIIRRSYDEYVWASASLYLDIINLFQSLLTVRVALVNPYTADGYDLALAYLFLAFIKINYLSVLTLGFRGADD